VSPPEIEVTVFERKTRLLQKPSQCVVSLHDNRASAVREVQIKGRVIRIEKMRFDVRPRLGHSCHSDIMAIDHGITGPVCANRLEVLDQLIVGVHPVYEYEVVFVKSARLWEILRRKPFRKLHARKEAFRDLAGQFRSDPVLATLHLSVNDVNETARAKSGNDERRESIGITGCR
jgi:hypothetical protein